MMRYIDFCVRALILELPAFALLGCGFLPNVLCSFMSVRYVTYVTRCVYPICLRICSVLLGL